MPKGEVMSILDISIEWWYWLVFGFILLLLELQDGSFLMLGLGVSAATVGGIEYIYSIKFTYQLLIWAFLSVAYIVIWKKFIHDSKPIASEKEYQAIGIVAKDIEPHKKGIVMFDTPIVGSREWKAIADMPIKKGESVRIVEIIQQTLKVEPVKGEQ
jgi:membrane protein implicated in regulation of membrane protease activity